MRRLAPAILVIALGVELLALLPLVSALLLVGIALWFAAPGVLFAYRALGSSAAATGTAWLVGPMLGFGFSVFGFLLLWAVGVPSALGLVLAPGFTLALASIVHRTGGASVRLPLLDRHDITGVAVALLIVPLITFAPYLHVRQRVADGEAYRAYFTADFVWAM